MIRRIFLVALVLAPVVALAQAAGAPASTPTDTITSNPLVVGPALVYSIQGIARLLAAVGAMINGKTSGAGSGWYKFWNTVAAFPGKGA